MKAIVMSSLIVLSMTSLAASAEEVSSSFSWGDVVFQPRIYAGYADYQLKSGNFNVVYQDRVENRPTGFFYIARDDGSRFHTSSDIQFSGVLGGIGATIASGPFFGDYYYQSTLNETAYSSESTK